MSIELQNKLIGTSNFWGELLGVVDAIFRDGCFWASLDVEEDD